ncbi:MAG: nucleotidyltransferase family protein [Candidatus Dechloromonas phosphoritropha]
MVAAPVEAKGVRYAVIKSAYVRDPVYADPALRPASDIDILIAPELRLAAVDAKKTPGFNLVVNPEVASHEACLIWNGVDIDLHGDILRPGCTPVATIDIFLAYLCRHEGVWGLNDANAIFIILFHAVSSLPSGGCLARADIHLAHALLSWW